jgi:hypothetical protein
VGAQERAHVATLTRLPAQGDKKYFKGAERLVRQAKRQSRMASGIPIRWHVAEPRMVDILKKLFRRNRIEGIDVVHTPP